MSAKEEPIQKASKSVAKEFTQVRGFTLSKEVELNYDPYILIKYSMRDPIIRAAINKKAIRVMSGGWEIVPIKDLPGAEQQKDAFMEFAKTAGGIPEASGEQLDLDSVIFKMLLSLEEGDEIFTEVRNNLLEVPAELHVQDWEDMRIITEKEIDPVTGVEVDHGKVDGYSQVVDDITLTTWEHQEIIHRNLFSKGTRKYGVSLLRSVLELSAGRLYARKYSNSLFVNQSSKGIWTFNMGEEDYNKNVDAINESKEQAWHYTYLRGKPDQIKYEPIKLSDEMAYKDYIIENRIEILACMDVSPGSVFLPGDTGWSADVQNAEMDIGTNFRRTLIEGIFNNQILPRFGFDAIKFKINRSNKRDQEKEAMIAVSLKDAGIMTVNEAREAIGLESMKDKDIFEPKQSMPGFQSSNQHEDTTDTEGINAGEKDLSLMLNEGKYYPSSSQAIPKDPTFFRATQGHDGGMFNKALSRRSKEDWKLIQKDALKVNALENNYVNHLTKLLSEYVGEISNLAKNIGLDSFVSKIKLSRLSKARDPTKEVEAIDEIKREFLSKSRTLSSTFITNSWDEGISTAEIELGIPISRAEASGETLKLLDNMNNDLVDGAFTEIAARAKTQIRLGILGGESIQEITKRLENVSGSIGSVYRNRMRTIARTEVLKAFNEGSIAAYETSNVVKQVQVLVGPGPDDAAICERIYGAAPGTLSKPFDFSNLPHPQSATHPNCKCVVVPVINNG